MHEMVLTVWRRPAWRPACLLLTAAVLLAASAGALRADACSACTAPTVEDLATVPGFTLHALPPNIFGSQPTDYLEIDAGECTYNVKSDPAVSIVSTRLVLRGSGEVWTCPESSSDDQISFSIAAGDSTEWTVAGDVGATLKALALEVAAKLKGSYTGGRTVTEVRTITKTLRAAMGHRIPWEGYFEVASLATTVVIDVTRRWSWWTKNSITGHTVLRSGSIWMSCGSEQVELSREASIGYRMHLWDRACGPMAPPAHDLGFYPPLPGPTTEDDKTTATTPAGAPGTVTNPPPAPGLPPIVPPAPATPPAPGSGAPAGASDEPVSGATPEGAAPPGLPFPPPSPINPPPPDSSEAGMAPTGPIPDPQAGDPGTAPTGPVPDPHAFTLADGTVAVVVGDSPGSDA